MVILAFVLFLLTETIHLEELLCIAVVVAVNAGILAVIMQVPLAQIVRRDRLVKVLPLVVHCGDGCYYFNLEGRLTFLDYYGSLSLYKFLFLGFGSVGDFHDGSAVVAGS